MLGYLACQEGIGTQCGHGSSVVTSCPHLVLPQKCLKKPLLHVRGRCLRALLVPEGQWSWCRLVHRTACRRAPQNPEPGARLLAISMIQLQAQRAQCSSEIMTSVIKWPPFVCFLSKRLNNAVVQQESVEPSLLNLLLSSVALVDSFYRSLRFMKLAMINDLKNNAARASAAAVAAAWALFCDT